jgi:hypothetical protein
MPEEAHLAFGRLTSARSFDWCTYCGDADMTEEHIVADWVLRAFARSRKPRSGFKGTFVGPAEMRLEVGEARSTSEIVCRRCDNEWMSAIDQAAADALKPLVQGRIAVELNPRRPIGRGSVDLQERLDVRRHRAR